MARGSDDGTGSSGRDALTALRQDVARLTHELYQPITAIANYLQASNRLLSYGTPSDLEKVQDAIRQSLAEVSRAGELLQRLRRSASLDVPDQ